MQMSKEVHILKLDDILPNRFQPRIVFDESAINELTESIKQYGVIEPIIVRKVADKYEIIAGERRYKASVLAGKESIPAIITDLNDKDSAEIALIENVQRQNLTPIEEAVSYKKILDMGYMNQSELAEKLGKTQSTIANKLRLLNLTDTVQEALLQERISERHARSLLRLPSDKQDAMLDKIIKNRMTVRKTDEEINKILSGGESSEEGTSQVEKEKNNEEVSIENKKAEEVSNLNINNENILLNQNESKEEKEEDNMNNNDFMNQFNIPNTPIIEPQTEPQFTNESKIQGQQSPVMQQANPSQFMQTQNIQPQFVQPNSFENQVQQPINVQNQYVGQSQPVQQTIPNGQNFFNNIQQPQTQPVPVVEQSVPTNEGNQFQNSISYDQNMAPQTINNEPASALNDDTPISGRFFNMFGESNENDLSQTAQTQEYTQAVPEQPQNFDFNPFGNMSQPQPQVQPTPVEPINNNYSEPIPMPNVPVAPEMSQSFNQPQAQPEFINSVQPFQLNDNQEFTNSSVVELGTLGNNRMEEPTLQPLMDSNEPKITMDMKQVINLIRNCADQIEKSGYTIDTDELDFDDHYQVVFKINKID